MIFSCKPIPLPNLGVQIHTLNLGGGVSETPRFKVFFEGRPQNLRGESSPPKFRGYGLTGLGALPLTSLFKEVRVFKVGCGCGCGRV